MNYAIDPWYEERRNKVTKAITSGKPVKAKREKRDSPSGKYSIHLTPYRVKDPACPYYCVVELQKNGDGEILGKIVRNEADFPFVFVENWKDGKDYLICAEDYQGFTVINITDKKKYDYIAEKSKRGLAMHITDFYISPDKECLAVEGHIRSKPSDVVETDEVHFFRIGNNITEIPYKEVDKRITFAYDKVVGWETKDRFIISRIEDYIVPSGTCLDEIQDPKERLRELGQGNIKKQTAYYVYLPKTGEMEKVFSEWR